MYYSPEIYYYFVNSRNGLTIMTSFVKQTWVRKGEILQTFWTVCLYFKLLYVKLSALVINFMHHLLIMKVFLFN